MCSLLTAEQQDQTRTGQAAAAAASLPSCLPRLRPGRGAECWPGADLHTVTVSLRPARTGEEKARCADSRRGHWVSHYSEVSTSHTFAGSLHLTQAVPGPGDAGVVCHGHQPHQLYTRHRNKLSERNWFRSNCASRRI